MLNEQNQQYIVDMTVNSIWLKEAFTIVKGTDAEFGIDGNQYFYKTKGDLAEHTCIAGFGITPYNALMSFRMQFIQASITTPVS